MLIQVRTDVEHTLGMEYPLRRFNDRGGNVPMSEET
jgi:hypothetical protein